MGFFSTLWAAKQATVSNSLTEQQQQLDKKIGELLDAVNSASQHVRNYYVIFLLASLYIGLIIWSTTDEMLLKNTPLKMPILEVELSITGFYTFAPYFFLLLHFNLLLQLSLLASKVHSFNQYLAQLVDQSQQHLYRTRLFSFAFTQTLSSNHHSRLMRVLLVLMVWITVIWLPLGILLGLQIGFLAYHSEDIVSWQRIATMIDLFCLFIFWPVIRASDGKWRSWIKETSGLGLIMRRFGIFTSWQSLPNGSVNLLSSIEALVGALTGVAIVGFIWAVAVLPESEEEKWVAQWLPEQWKTACPLSRDLNNGERYFRLTEFLFDGGRSTRNKFGCEFKAETNIFNRNLIIKNRLLIANTINAKDEAYLRGTDEKLIAEVLLKIKGLILAGRDLNYADFTGSDLPKVDFVDSPEGGVQKSDLPKGEVQNPESESPDRSKTSLKYASLSGANLREAKIQNLDLQGANLKGAELKGADLSGVSLQGADLWMTNLQDAVLVEANLQDAVLWQAYLQGANLGEAKLQGANLEGAGLQGAILRWANLQGADLAEAKLQGVDLAGAKLQGANLAGAGLQGANLEEASLQGTDLTEANIDLVDLTAVKLGILSASNFNAIRKVIEDLTIDRHRKQVIINRLQENIHHQAEFYTIGFQAIQDVWYEVDEFLVSADKIQTLGYLHGMQRAQSLSDYRNKLSQLLIQLACDDAHVAAGIIKFRNDIPGLPQCLLSMSAQRNKANALICPGVSALPQNTIDKLHRKILESAIAQSTEQRTFVCKTAQSD